MHLAECMLIGHFYFRQSHHFEHIMCLMMAPVDPPAAPYPSHRMQNHIHANAMDNVIYHYYDCVGRPQRDCKVYKYAESLLDFLIQATSEQV